MLADYENFDPREHSGEIALHDVACRFLGNFHKLMAKANFKLLTRNEETFAEHGSYELTIPTQAEWDKLDGDLLQRFHSSEVCPKALKQRFECGFVFLIFLLIGVVRQSV